MICMVYISSAVLGLSDRQIKSMVKAARINNEKLHVTGLLLYNNGNFMQLLEGEDTNVENLYEKIKQDTRHTGVTLLIKESITHKNFDNWLMGYRSLNKVDSKLLSQFLNEDLNFSIYKNNPYRALQFLETFKKIIS